MGGVSIRTIRFKNGFANPKYILRTSVRTGVHLALSVSTQMEIPTNKQKRYLHLSTWRKTQKARHPEITKRNIARVGIEPTTVAL